MCGIVGYLGKKEAKDVIIKGLKRLEYRGYDSAGISTLQINKLEIEGSNNDINNNLDNDINNVVFITGDTHQSWAFEVNHEPLNIDESMRAYAYEFGTPSINSGNSDERYPNAPIEKLIDHENLITNSPINPHLKFSNSRDHGYLVLSLSEDKVIARWSYVNTLIRRENSIKKEVKFEGHSNNYKLKKEL